MTAQAEFNERASCVACGSSNVTELSSGAYHDEPLRSFLNEDPWGENPLPHFEDATWSLRKCQDCGQMFHGLILTETWNDLRFSKWMSAEAIEAFEQDLGKRTPDRVFAGAASRVQHVLRIRDLVTARWGGTQPRLLDFGCGFGDFVAQCRLFGFDAVGVDRATARRDNALVPILASLEEVPEEVHAITAFEVLEHVDAPADILSDLFRHLMPGGILVLTTPDCAGITTIHDRDSYLKIHPMEHINAFTHDSLRAIAERVGFQFMKKPVAHVCTRPVRVVKDYARQISGRENGSTQLYFRKP